MVTGTKESLLEHKKQLDSVYPIKAGIIGAGSTRSIKAPNRRICWGETGIVYQHAPRHVDVLAESLGRESGNTVQTPIVDDGRERESSVVGTRAIVPKNVRSFATQFLQIEATRSVLEGREILDPSFRIRGHGLRSDSGLDTNDEIVKRGSRARGTTPLRRVHKKTEDHRQKQCRSRTQCSGIGSVRSDRGPEHDV